jgi:hypothetical protein
VTPGQGINEGDINPLVINRKLQDGTPQQQTYDPLLANQHFNFGRVKFRKNGTVVGSYDPFDNDKNIELPDADPIPDYKGIVTIAIDGACIDQPDPITGVASKIVSDTFADAEVFPSGDNRITSITYEEVTGKPSDSKPEFHIDNQGHLYYTFAEENQERLVFDMIVHFHTMQGFGYIADGDVEFAANSAIVPQPVMAINQRIPVQKTIDGVGGKILDTGIILVVPKSSTLGSGYHILLRAEYWYRSSH